MLKKHKKILSFLLLLIILLLLFRIDYRFKTTVECCSDDYDYFLHASTLALDFDLDYSNQNPRGYSFRLNNKNTPIGFFGSGLLSSPFLYLGNFISKSIGEDVSNVTLNYKLLFYSISSIFYLIAGYFLLFYSLKELKIKFDKYFLLLIFISPGVGYFAFERFSMTHPFEVFGVSLIIYSSIRFYQGNGSRIFNSALLPLSILISYLTRMSNIYIFLLPFFVKKIMTKKNIEINNKILKDKFLLLFSLLSLMVFIYISIRLYGEIIINPQKIYGSNINLVSEVFQLGEFMSSFIKTNFYLLFSLEFGLLWVSPILFCGFIYILSNLKDFYKLEYLIFVFAYLQNILIVYIWQAAGSSYGFRYLYSLIPLSIVVFYSYQNHFIFLKKYLLIFSIFSLLSLLFFETTTLTQLSTSDVTNTFGKNIRYSQPEYVKGLIMSFIKLESYLIIFTTSFVGVVFFKILLVFLSIENLNIFLEKLGLPVYNQDFQDYLINVEALKIDKVIFIILFLSYIAYLIVFKIDSRK